MAIGEMSSAGQAQMHASGMGSGAQMGQQPMMEYASQTFHSHGLPPESKRLRMGEEEASMQSIGAPSVVGMAGMPEPAARPRGPKLKFTPEDDQKLVDLKENKSLTWKQIADFFPGRSSGTLQVRYCTKLKAKTTQWTDETVSFRFFSITTSYLHNIRSKNYRQLFMTMNKKNGGSLLKRSAQASLQQLARKRLRSLLAHAVVTTKLTMVTLMNNNQCLPWKQTLLSLETQHIDQSNRSKHLLSTNTPSHAG